MYMHSDRHHTCSHTYPHTYTHVHTYPHHTHHHTYPHTIHIITQDLNAALKARHDDGQVAVLSFAEGAPSYFGALLPTVTVCCIHVWVGCGTHVGATSHAWHPFSHAWHPFSHPNNTGGTRGKCQSGIWSIHNPPGH